MLKTLTSLGFEALVGLVLGYLAGRFIGWWSLPIVTAISSFYFKTSVGKAFAAGTAAGTLLWLLYSGILNFANGGQLSGMLAETFHLTSGAYLMNITVLIGGLLGGMGALCGALARNVILDVTSQAAPRLVPVLI